MTLTTYTTEVAGASHWSLRVRKGTLMRLTDLAGDANVGMLFYNPENLLERYNAPDTLKGQHTFKLTRGNCLYSDMGRVFASIVEDSFGWHDTVCGNLHPEQMKEKYGEHRYQDHHNDWYLSGHTSFLTELAKYGLSERDLAANLNLFSKVATDDDGKMFFDPSAAKPGARVTLRFEMETLVVMHTCPHPLSSAESYPYTPVRIELSQAAPVSDDDFCRNFRPENQRGFQNNALYHLGK